MSIINFKPHLKGYRLSRFFWLIPAGDQNDAVSCSLIAALLFPEDTSRNVFQSKTSWTRGNSGIRRLYLKGKSLTFLTLRNQYKVSHKMWKIYYSYVF